MGAPNLFADDHLIHVFLKPFAEYMSILKSVIAIYINIYTGKYCQVKK